MVIEYDGTTYEFDPDGIDVEQSLKIEKHIGGPMLEWEQGVLGGRTVCVQVLGWLILRRGALDVPIASVNFKVGKLMRAYTAAAEAEAAALKAAEEAEAAEGPTGAASTGRSRGPARSRSGSASSAPAT